MSVVMDTLVNRVEKFSSWDPTVSASRVVETVDDNHAVIYMKFKGVGPVTSRDLVQARTVRYMSDSSRGEYVLVAFCSIDHTDAPKTKSVRAHCKRAAWMLRSVVEDGTHGAKNSTELLWMSQTDVHSSAPSRIVNSVGAKGLSDWYSALFKACQASNS